MDSRTTLLFIAQDKRVKILQVFGDSKLTIDWTCSRVNITTVSLVHLIKYLTHKMNHFDWIYFQHICNQLNKIANNLSKEPCHLPKGAFGLYEFFDDEEYNAMEF
jgi:hypothetical protein